MSREKHPDREWLAKIKPLDQIGVLQPMAEEIASLIDTLRDDSALPHTVGIFGSWGCGKTATIAYLADELEARDYQILYFNAYKYASYMEVVPALIFRMIDELPIRNDAKAAGQLMDIISTLVGKYAGKFGAWTETKVGVNLVELGKELATIPDTLNKEEDRRRELLMEYYTRVDRAQDALKTVFDQSNLKKPLVVLIDELDRCDPGEAFEAMKQLRILFNMRGIRIAFVLVANPKPIGMAIRHQFGLDSSHDEFEAGRILEKFVDTYVDLSETESLGGYVESLWDRLLPKRLSDSSFIVGLDRRTDRSPDRKFEDHIVRNGFALERIATSNILYSNLRMLEKTLAYCASHQEGQESLWTIWHLTILKQSDPLMRSDIARIVEMLKSFTEQATLKLLEVLKDRGQIQPDGAINPKIDLNRHYACTPYAIYYDNFWEATNRRIRETYHTIGSEEAKIMAKLKENVATMNFIINLCMPSFGKLSKIRVRTGSMGSLRDAIGDVADDFMGNLGYLLGQD
jgi:hypothetical protein